MDNVTRLPTQHSQKPHCMNCKRDMPSVHTMKLESSPEDWAHAKLTAMTFHITCECGTRHQLTVPVKASG